MKILQVTLVLATLALSGCQSYSPQRYTAMPDNTPILKAIPAGAIKVAPFVLTASYSAICRGVGDITPPVNMTIPSYLQTALADELKVAGLYEEKSPKIVLSGNIETLSFSSTKSLTSGEWNIGLRLESSNGKSMYAAESYQFESAFEGGTACRRTAEALLPAVQSLISNIVRSANFRSLLEI